MCTLLALHRVHPVFPLIVAANRDEFTHRTAMPPQVLQDAPRVVGGRDLRHHGTWLGIHARGFFAGVTNQRTWTVPDPSRSSRGPLVTSLAAEGSVERVEARLRALPRRAHNPFNVLFGDADALAVAYVRDDDPVVEVAHLGPGLHVLANDRMGSPWFPKERVAHDRIDLAAVAAMNLDAVFAALRPVLADHSIPAKFPDPPRGARMPAMLARRLQALCVHTPGYGTVSATFFAVDANGVAAYRYADGAPCTHPFDDHTALFSPSRA